MNTFEIIPFSRFEDEYMNKLNEEISVFPKLLEIWINQTAVAYDQAIRSMNHCKSAPLRLFYDSPASMSSFTKKTHLVNALFDFVDINKIGRIDAFEINLTFLLISKVNNFDKLLDYMVTLYGVEVDKKLSKDEFCYNMDTMFRGLAKLLVKSTDDPFNYQPRMYRLSADCINKFANSIYGSEQYLGKDVFSKQVKNNAPELYEFLCYVHKRALGSKEGFEKHKQAMKASAS